MSTQLALKINLNDVLEQHQENLETNLNQGKAFYDTVNSVDGRLLRAISHNFYFNETEDDVIRNVKKFTDGESWKRIMNASGINWQMYMTRAEHSAFKDMVYENPCEFNVDNVKKWIKDVIGDVHNAFLKSFAEEFTRLDKRFKSHDGFSMGRRMILTRSNNEGGYSGNERIELRGDYKATFHKIIEMLKKLGTQIEDNEAYMARQSSGETVHINEKIYMRLYKNGNTHLWFSDDIVEIINKTLHSYYGDILPDATEFKEDHLDPKSREVSKNLHFYRTPSKVIDEMTQFVYFRGGEQVLEPSAGDGAIIHAILNSKKIADGAKFNIDAYEFDQGRYEILNNIKGITATQANFLKVTPVEKYDYVLMNPPFYREHCIDHVMHAWKFLKPKGLLLAVLPASVVYNDNSDKKKAFQKFIKNIDAYSPITDLDNGSFAESGTNVSTVILRLQKD